MRSKLRGILEKHILALMLAFLPYFSALADELPISPKLFNEKQFSFQNRERLPVEIREIAVAKRKDWKLVKEEAITKEAQLTCIKEQLEEVKKARSLLNLSTNDFMDAVILALATKIELKLVDYSEWSPENVGYKAENSGRMKIEVDHLHEWRGYNMNLEFTLLPSRACIKVSTDTIARGLRSALLQKLKDDLQDPRVNPDFVKPLLEKLEKSNVIETSSSGEPEPMSAISAS